MADPLQAAQIEALTAIAARILPPDERGPGAVELGAVTYVVRALAGELAQLRPLYLAGLARFDAEARIRHGVPLAAVGPQAVDALLRAAESGTLGAESQRFFALVRAHVLEGAFGDPRHGGNRDRAGWRLIGYDGPAMRLSVEHQAIDGTAPGGPSSAEAIRETQQGVPDER